MSLARHVDATVGRITRHVFPSLMSQPLVSTSTGPTSGLSNYFVHSSSQDTMAWTWPYPLPGMQETQLSLRLLGTAQIVHSLRRMLPLTRPAHQARQSLGATVTSAYAVGRPAAALINASAPTSAPTVRLPASSYHLLTLNSVFVVTYTPAKGRNTRRTQLIICSFCNQGGMQNQIVDGHEHPPEVKVGRRCPGL